MSENMPPKKRGLGMGLSALLGAEPVAGPVGESAGLETVPIEFLEPSSLQPRRHFDEEELASLADSLRSKGILQPLVVRQRAGSVPGYEIIAGERRWRAAQIAGLHELPVLVRELSDRDVLEVALVENLQREDLSAIEEATAFQRLVDEFGHSQERLAEALGKSRSHIANTLRLLRLPEELRGMVEDGRLSAGHARALLTSPDPAALAHLVVERELSVRQTEALARTANSRKPRPEREPIDRDPDIEATERRLAEHLGLDVKIGTGKRGGTLTIRYRSNEQLDGVLGRLLGQDPSL